MKTPLKFIFLAIGIITIFCPLSIAKSFGISTTQVVPSTTADSLVASTKDRIRLRDGKVIVCEIIKISDRFIYYNQSGNADMQFVTRAQVKAIARRGGAEEPLGEGAVAGQVKRWEDVRTTKTENDVKGMLEVGPVVGKAIPSGNRRAQGIRSLEEAALVVLKRRGAEMNADMILITETIQYVAYGDTPSVTIKGVAFRDK